MDRYSAPQPITLDEPAPQLATRSRATKAPAISDEWRLTVRRGVLHVDHEPVDGEAAVTLPAARLAALLQTAFDSGLEAGAAVGVSEGQRRGVAIGALAGVAAVVRSKRVRKLVERDANGRIVALVAEPTP